MFSNGSWNTDVESVGELVDELSKLPRDMPLKQGFSEGANITVFNRDTDPHVSIEEHGYWGEDA